MYDLVVLTCNSPSLAMVRHRRHVGAAPSLPLASAVPPGLTFVAQGNNGAGWCRASRTPSAVNLNGSETTGTSTRRLARRLECSCIMIGLPPPADSASTQFQPV